MKADKYIWVVIILCLINFFLRLPFVHLLPYNDAPVYYDAVLKVLNNHLNPFTFYISYKPPVLILFIALLFRLFTPSLAIGSIFVYCCSSLSLLFTYLLGKRLFGEKTGLYATVLLFIFPLFVAQSFFFNDAVFVTFLTLMTMYAYFVSNKPWYFISATLLVLTKEPQIFIPISLGLYEMYRMRFLLHRSFNSSVRQGLLLWTPVLAFILWMGANKIIFGFYLDPVNVGLFNLERNYAELIPNMLHFTFLFNGVWLIWPGIISYVVIYIAHTIHRNKARDSKLFFFLFLFLLYIPFYFFTSLVPRYMLPLYPYLFLVACATINLFFSEIKSLLLFAIICVLYISVHISHYYYLPMDYWGETDLNLFHVTALYTKSIDYIHSHYPHALIVTIPWLYQWDTPFFTYSNPSYKENMYFWNILTDEHVEFQHILEWAKARNLSPVIFIAPSYIDGPNEPIILNSHREKVEILYDNSINRYNYHVLYRISEDVVSTNE